MTGRKRYLGDAVYVELNEFGQLVLTTDNGLGQPSNTIFLEPEVWAELERFVRDLTGRSQP